MRVGSDSVKYGVVSAICLALASMTPQAQAQGSITKRLEFLKDQTGCRSDIATFCSGINAGSGKLYRCLDKNKARLTESCIKAMPEAERLLRQAGLLGAAAGAV